MVDDSGAVAGRDFRQNATYAAGRDMKVYVHPSEERRPWHALPRDIELFIGRASQIVELEALLVPARAPSPVVIIANGPGCGKTALAVRVAHNLADRFPSAQLHVRLGGEGQPDLLPEDALRRLLVQLGHDAADLPKDADSLAAMYRAHLPEGSLVVLDNAMSEEQVEPLLPAGPGCAAIVTSRFSLPGLEGMRVLELGELPDDEAHGLLGELISEERVASDPESARLIVDLCGRLPLALRVAGSLLSTRAKRRLPLAEFAGRLADEGHRLDLLRMGHTAVRASFALSYETLSPAAARLFRLLGGLHVADVHNDLVRKVDGTAGADDALDELINAYLIEPIGAERVRFHDLIRLFAEERAHEEEPRASCTEALRRACDWARERVAAGDHGELDRERTVLTSIIDQASDDETVWRLAAGLADFFEERGHRTNWLGAQTRAVESAIRLGDPVAHGVSLHHLARVQRLLRRTPEALESATRAVALLETTAEDRKSADALAHLAVIHRELHRHEDAVAVLGEAARIYQGFGDPKGVGQVLRTLGHVHAKRRELPEAIETLRRAVSLLHDAGDRDSEGWSHNNLISAYDAAGEPGKALEHFEIAREIFRGRGNRQGEAWAYNHAGRVHRSQGNTGERVACHEWALALFKELGDKYGRAWATLDLGDATGDADAIREALAEFEKINEAEGQAWALTMLAAHERDPALIERALALFEVVGGRHGQEIARRIGEDLKWNR